MIDALASRPHYADHIEPVFSAVPEPGTFYRRSTALGHGAPTIVASFYDSRWAAGRPVIYMEHGSGQTYGDNPSYAGGKAKGHVSLFLNVNERVDALNRARYPNAAHAVVGCPMLDRWMGHRPENREPVVAFAWHFEALAVAPEATSAFRHYAQAIPSLPYRLLGHAHPRGMSRIRPFYMEHGIEVAETFDEVLRRADVLVFDNTSAGFMFAATGRPVVVLDAPWYRRAWGGRFWEWADVGVRISDPADLSAAIAQALVDEPQVRIRREQITEAIYPHRGEATQRAVDAIAETFGRVRAAA